MDKKRIPFFILIILIGAIGLLLTLFGLVAIMDQQNITYSDYVIKMSRIYLILGSIMILCSGFGTFVTIKLEKQKFVIFSLIINILVSFCCLIFCIYMTVLESIETNSIRALYYFVLYSSFIISLFPIYFIIKMKTQDKNIVGLLNEEQTKTEKKP